MIVVLLLALLGAGALASVALAAEPVWVSNSHTLLTGETKTVVAAFSNQKIRWEDKSTAIKFEVECKKAKGEAELKGGFPGTDKLSALALEECTLVKMATGCKLSAGPTAEELPGWSSEL